MQLDQYLCEELSLTMPDLKSFLSAAPNKYKVYTIPKRSSGSRVIAHPAKKLKAYQKAGLKHLDSIFEVHQSSFAYRKGIGIKDNARSHLNSRYLLKMDFQNFFYSIKPNLLFEVANRLNINFSKDEKKVLTQLLFWRPSKRSKGQLVLSVGAPSSPFISNIILFLFDKELDFECKKQGIKYTRYADDLTFSTNVKDVLFDVPVMVKKLLLTHLDGYISINETKTVFTSKAHNRHVTGVTLANDGTLSIGRKRKRYISSLIHKFSLGELPVEDYSYLQGLLAFASDIEPIFITRMENKYSLETMSQIRKGVS